MAQLTFLSGGRFRQIENVANFVPQALKLYEDNIASYRELYRTQPAVRTCVDFLARNIAQIGLHVFRKIDTNNRERVESSPLVSLLNAPLPPAYKITQYRFLSYLMSDLGIYNNTFWLKLKDKNTVTGLYRLPPEYVAVYGKTLPQYYEIDMGDGVKRFELNDVVHILGYNPGDSVVGLSPIESLRRTLAEETAAGEYREGFWRTAARQSGIISRPLAAPEWSDTARDRFRQEFQSLYSGSGGSGKTAVLEDGMTWQATAFSARDSEYSAARKLSLEEVARAYFIPPPLIGILDNATLANVGEYHKQLYQDTLGPYLRMIESDLNSQLAPDFGDDDIYIEFNVDAKLRGSFEEQAAIFQATVGAPIVTPNEARARLNLPPLGGGDELVRPLNVVMGAQASPQDVAGVEDEALPVKNLILERKAFDNESEEEYLELLARSRHEWELMLTSYYDRVQKTMGSRAGAFVGEPGIDGMAAADALFYDIANRWNPELAADIQPDYMIQSADWAGRVLKAAGIVIAAGLIYDAVGGWSHNAAKGIAGQLNENMFRDFAALMASGDISAKDGLFKMLAGRNISRQAGRLALGAAGFGRHKGAQMAGLSKKTWVTSNTKNPRDLHRGMNGETVPLFANFSNGMKWPGDPAGGAENNAHCQCRVVFS